MRVQRLLLCFSFFGWSLNAQHVLRPSAEIPAAGISNSVTAGPVRCDPHGDIYLRVASAPDVTHELLTRIGRDGGMTTFGPERVSDPELKEWRLADFIIRAGASQIFMLQWPLATSAIRLVCCRWERSSRAKAGISGLRPQRPICIGLRFRTSPTCGNSPRRFHP